MIYSFWKGDREHGEERYSPYTTRKERGFQAAKNKGTRRRKERRTEKGRRHFSGLWREKRRENRRRVQNLVGSRGEPHWSWDS